MKKHPRRIVKRKRIIPEDDYKYLEDIVSAINEFLEDERFEPIRSLMLNQKKYIEETVIKNVLSDSEERHTISDTLIRVFKKPKKEQMLELAGQYKFIENFLDTLNEYVQEKKRVDKGIQEEEYEIR